MLSLPSRERRKIGVISDVTGGGVEGVLKRSGRTEENYDCEIEGETYCYMHILPPPIAMMISQDMQKMSQIAQLKYLGKRWHKEMIRTSK